MSLVQLPDLSNQRLHPDVHHLTASFPLAAVHRDIHPLVLAVFARLLGLYCAVDDLLLGIISAQGAVSPFQFSCNSETTWSSALCRARAAIDSSQSVSASQLPEIKHDFVAFFALSTHTADATPSLLYSPEDGLLSFRATSDRMCSAVASMLLRQIAAYIEHISTDTTRTVASPLTLPDDLASLLEALPSDRRTACYSHIPPLQIAPDCILPHVHSTPNATAVVWYPSLSSEHVTDIPFETLSYSQLHSTANKFARFLLARGLSPQDKVAVSMDRNLIFHTIMFGVLRAGACYVPIDPELPPERKHYIVQDSGAKFVIMSAHLHSPTLFADLSIDVDDPSIQAAMRTMSDADLDPFSPNSLAYMLYTSGTTGNPKGCLLTHQGLAEAITAISSIPAAVDMDDIRKGRYLAVASIAFDVHLAEIFVPLALGMALCCARRSELFENLPQHISRLDITHVGLVPSLIDATMGAAEDNDLGGGIKLRYIASGGEKISDSILDKWADHPQVRLANFYGPSEVTIGCCARFMDSSTPRANIGRSFANVSSYVVDSSLNILPRGVIGELIVAGPLVGHGYHGRSDLTAKVFLEWPRPGSWAYRTGDQVRMMPDGTLEILGRIDTQIKLRGVRIEAEGISAVLRKAAHDGLGLQLDTGTVLTAHPLIGNGGSPQLVSFVAWDNKVPVATRRSVRPHVVSFPGKMLQVLRAACGRELASYMQPAHVIPLSWLPLNSNGKADSKILDGIFKDIAFDTLITLGQGIPTTSVSTRPFTDVQRKLLVLVEKRFKVQDSVVNTRTSLFAYGMDSLSLSQFASDIRRTFQAPVSTAEIMRNPSIEGVSALLGSSSSVRVVTSGSFIEKFSATWFKVIEEAVGPLRVERVLPPFSVQEGVLYRSDSLPTSCVQHVIMKISDTLPLSRVRHAWEAAMKRLDVLRTVFYFGRDLVQVILQSTDVQLPWREESNSMITDNDDFSEFFFAHEASSLSTEINHAVSTVPSFRLNIYPGMQSRWLVLSIHHALFDGISLPLILKYVEDEILGNSHAPTPSAEQLLEYIHSADSTAARDFWISNMNGFDWSTLRPMDVAPLSRPQRKTVPITVPLTSLTQLVAPCQVTLQAALTCTFATLLAQYMYRSDDVIFGVIRSGRLLPVDGIETALYPTISVLPLRVRLDMKNCLQHTQQDISAAVSFEHFPLAQVQKWVCLGHSLFDTLFAVSVKDSTRYEVLEVKQSELSQPDFALSVEVLLDMTEDTVVVQAAYYDDGGYLASKVDQILTRFESVLLNVLKNVPIPSVVTLDRPEGTVPARVSVPPQTLDEEGEGVEDVTLDLEPLQEIVSQFLGVAPQSVHPRMSFISLGLDSIRSVGLAKMLRQHGYTVTAADIMKRPSLQKLGVLFMRSPDRALIEETDGADTFLRNEHERLFTRVDPSSFKLSMDDVVNVYPTTALQSGMLSQTVASSGRLYFHAFPLALDAGTDLASMQEAWHHTINQLDILRTTFHYVSDLEVWIQARHSVARFDWAEQSWNISKSLEDSIEEIASTLRLTDETAFERPPVYFRVLRSYMDKDHLVLFIHHALYDGLSVANLLAYVERVYRQQEVQLVVQFFDILPRLLFQQSRATAYWVQRLEHYRPASLPRINPQGRKTIIASRNVTFTQQALVRFVNDTAVTLQCLGQAAWAKYLASVTSSLDVVFGHVVSGRSVDDAEDVIGPILNTVPCRVQFSSRQSNRDLLRAIHRENVDALPWQHVSLRAVQNEMRVQSLCSSLFLFQPQALESATSESESGLWTLYDSGEFDAQIQYPLNVEFHKTGSGFVIKMVCSPDVMDTQGLTGALADLEALLRDLVYPEHTAIPALPLRVSADEPEGTSTEIKSVAHEHLRIPPELSRILVSMTSSSIDQLDPAQSLAALGIDSISAISLRSKCKNAGLILSIADIVSSRTIGELLSKVKAGVDNESVAVEPSATFIPVSKTEHEAVVAVFPEEWRSQITSVSVTTEGMKWLIGAWQRSQRTRFQHVFAYRLGRNVDIPKLRESWKALLACHPILRSTIASAPGHGLPRIVTFAVEVVDTSLTEEVLEVGHLHALAIRMKDIVSSPLPASAPQTRGTILTTSKDRYLLIRMHHFQYDAFSLELLLDDLKSVYQGAAPRSSTNLAAFMNRFAPAEVQLLEQRAYWTSVMPIPFVPKYFPSLTEGKYDDIRSPRRTVVTVKSAVPGAAALDNAAQRNGLPLYAVLLACWASTQAAYTSSDTVLFGLWHAGRTGDVECIDRLAVPCMNVLPVHAAVLGELRETVRRLQEDLYKRTPLIQQSNLEKVDEWVTGGKGIPLTNVFVNVFKVARNSNGEQGLFESVEVDYAVPIEPPSFGETVIHELPISKLIQDDVMIDIVINEKLDAITMSIESAPAVMDGECALEVINDWVSRVEDCLSSGVNDIN
ncbi:hypothetical protein F5I97DRAFT_1801464 [Phlebopus sp. FC_14]|nr:hypothetical protein F5I97DRAFT_1801464 [Phlebopus sp. FC_14]